MNIKEKMELAGHLDTILELIVDIYKEKENIVAENNVMNKCDKIRDEIKEMYSFIVNSR